MDARTATGVEAVAGSEFGAYQIVRLIGRGGMGAVYEAVDRQDGRRVALKVLDHNLDTADNRKRFLREGRLAASINHPNTVYIYGTEEIAGDPVIVMELVAGGTLEQRVQDGGPLPISDAVEAALEITAGLEAAASIGILHRDVKPSNCFLSRDGAVKVGDFGLSISTEARGESNITAAGLFLGTPSFSSPEQLLGEPLDLRADIYAVGVTLYYLLTGKLPHGGVTAVQVVAAALNKPATPPRARRPDIPSELDAVVLRCLARKPTDRFQTYDALRAALEPLQATTFEPAPRSLRAAAMVVDWLLVSPMGWAAELAASHFAVPLNHPLRFLMTFVSIVLYFALSEGVWGMSLGKWLTGLRVVHGEGTRVGVPRAAARATMIFGTLHLAGYLVTALTLSSPTSIQALSGLLPLLPLALFVSARRRNGYAGLHDLLTGTRVVRPVRRARPRAVAQHALEFEPIPAGAPRIGPYAVLGPIPEASGPEWAIGFDERLHRRVWIRQSGPETPLPLPVIQNLGRPGRLRWVNGRRSAEENYDAYEALDGGPLRSSQMAPRPWIVVRGWLFDLAEEMAVAEQDGTLPPVLALDRVWITASGRAILLDFPAPGASNTAANPLPLRNPIQMVAQTAWFGLTGNEATAPAQLGEFPPVPLPLYAREALAGIIAHPEETRTRLLEVATRPATITRRRRFTLLAATGAPALLIATFMVGMVGVWARMAREHPDLAALGTRLQQYDAVIHGIAGGTTDAEVKRTRRALEVTIAGRFRRTVLDPATWVSSTAAMLNVLSFRATAQRIVAEHPEATEQDAIQAEEQLSRASLPSGVASLRQLPLLESAIFVLYNVFWMVALGSVLCALLFRGGLFIHALGIEFVTADGRPASRPRLVGRSAPLVVLMAIPFLFMGTGIRSIGMVAGEVAALGLLLAGAAYALVQPDRGILDRIARTWMVPR